MEHNTFPKHSTPYWLTYLRLIRKQRHLKQFISSIGKANILGFPHSISTKAWSMFAPLNPNNTGTWSSPKTHRYMETVDTEHHILNQLKDLYHAPQNLAGYIPSGSTEGNILACWIGRKYLNKITKNQDLALIYNDLSHYSIIKAADICNINIVKTNINTNTFTTDTQSLIKTIKSQYKKGVRGFLIPFTLGHTIGCTQDDYQSLIEQIRKLKQTHKQIHTFIWLDAATNGLTLPFSSKFQPFKLPEIQLITTDFHKYWGVNYPAGIVLYRPKLQSFIQQPISYLNFQDATVLGSRPGTSAMSIWALIDHLGSAKMRQIVQTSIDKKNVCIQQVKDKFPDCQIITDPQSTGLALIPMTPLSKSLKETYGLYLKRMSIQTTKGKKNIQFYSAYFLAEF